MPLPIDSVVFIALGSNLGDPAENVRRAMARLQALSDRPLMRSSLWRSAPLDCPPGSPDFVNAIAGMVPRPGETPEGLLSTLQAIEREFGRKPKQVPNEPRPLDLDLIAFGGLMIQSPRLVLPHPRAMERQFVLAPLAEIAPQLRLPGAAETVAERLQRFGKDETGLRRIA